MTNTFEFSDPKALVDTLNIIGTVDLKRKAEALVCFVLITVNHWCNKCCSLSKLQFALQTFNLVLL